VWVLRAITTAAGAGGVTLLGWALSRLPLTLCLALIVGGIGLLAIVLRPAVGLCALAFTIPFGSIREVSLGGVSIGLSQILVLATVGAWIARRLAFGGQLVARTGVTWALAAYLGTLLVSLWPAQNLPLAAKEIAKWVELAAVYWLAAGELSDRWAQGLVAALLAAGALQGLLGIYQFVHQVGPPGFVLMGRFMRAHGTFAQPNPYAGYLGLLLPLAYATVLSTWREVWPFGRRGDRPSFSTVAPWFLALVSSVAMAAGLVMSWSRGALLGAVVGAVLVLLALGRRAWLVLALVALLLVPVSAATPSLLPASLAERITEAVAYIGTPDVTAVEVTDANFATIERLAHWRAAWLMFQRSPWLGVGTGQYAAVYPAVAVPRWEDPLGHAHNVLLNVMAEGGLLGLATYLALMAAALWATWRAAREARRVGRGIRRGIALGALGMLGHLLTHNLVDNLFVHELYLLVAMLLGMAAARVWRATLTADGAR